MSRNLRWTAEAVARLGIERATADARKRTGDAGTSTDKGKGRKARQGERTTLAAGSYHWAAYGIPEPQREFRFHPVRGWRFDFAWPEHRIAVEQEGGVWSGGRHTRAEGYLADMEKYNHAVLEGWQLYRFTPEQMGNGEALRFLQTIFER